MRQIAVILASVIVAACASSPKTDSPQAASAKGSNSSSAANASASSVATADISSKQILAELQQLESQSDYFDFDKYEIKPAYLNMISKEAAFLKEHRSDVVTLQGNCDERGSREYNHALGNKRANAVRNSLEHLGVSKDQILTVSFGKDKPRLLCHDEKCWSENRRVDFVHKLN